MKNLVLGAIAGVLVAAVVPQTIPILLLGLFVVLAALIVAEAIEKKEIVTLNLMNPVQGEGEEKGSETKPMIGFEGDEA